MRVAALYDIHGNLPALEAVLEEVDRESVDQVVVGGDLYPGPMSNECLERLRGLDRPVHFLRGNGDRQIVELARGGSDDRIPEVYRESMHWVARRLEREHRRAIDGWPATFRLEIDGLGEVLFCHATPRSDTEIFTRLTPEDRLVPIFEEPQAAIVVCGHTHMQFDRQIGTVRVVNAGSVGMPFGEAGAFWLMLGPEVEWRRTSYDLEPAVEHIRACGGPGVEGFIARNIAERPSEREMLEVFSKTELPSDS